MTTPVDPVGEDDGAAEPGRWQRWKQNGGQFFRKGWNKAGGAAHAAGQKIGEVADQQFYAYKRDDPNYHKEDHIKFGCFCCSSKGDYVKDYREGLQRSENYNSNVHDGRLHQLPHDLAMTYYWSGNFFWDYVFFVCQWHPLLGIFFSHPAHPWSKTERVLTFFVSCSLTLLPASIVLSVDWKAADEDTSKKVASQIVFVCITVPVMIMETVMYYMSISEMYFDRNRVGCMGGLCWCIRWMTKCFKNCCFLQAVCVSIGVITMAFFVCSAAAVPIGKLCAPFLLSRCQSWATWFPLWFFLPMLGFLHGWFIEKKAVDARQTDAYLCLE